MCLRKTGQYSSIFDCARKLYREHGMWIFYRGYIPNLVGILPYAGIDLALYETFKTLYVKALNRSTEKSGTQKLTGPPVYVSLTAGACSSVCGQVATYPLALIKTKLQAESEKVRPPLFLPFSRLEHLIFCFKERLLAGSQISENILWMIVSHLVVGNSRIVVNFYALYGTFLKLF